MRHHLYSPDFKFTVEPEDLNKYAEREILQYCLGTIMYMPGTEDFAPKIISGSMPGLTTIVLCSEDACSVDQMETAEVNVHRLLDTVADTVDAGALPPEKIPLIFVCTRNLAQFRRFGDVLTKRQVRFLCSISFSRFNVESGYEYYAYPKDLNGRFGEILYGMPIIESPEVAYKESHVWELMGVKRILDEYHDFVLQVRVGGTDSSSILGMHHDVDYSIYDIMTVRECLAGIVNVYGRKNDYTISGPVQEYLRIPKAMTSEELPHYGLEDYLMKRPPTVDNEIDGLLREVILDKASGFVGRIVIHPAHVEFVNTLMAITKKEYDDACMILGHMQGDVVKGSGASKMDEAKPHTSWARKVHNRARTFGVIENEGAYIKLFTVNES